MYSSFTVIGKAVKSFEDRDAQFIVVNDGKGDIACRFFGKSKAQAEKIGSGDLVLIEGYASSREYKGKYYTELNASFARVFNRETIEGGLREDAVNHDGNKLPF